jgi:proline iminopeptidase
MKKTLLIMLSSFLFLSGCEEELNVKEPGLLVPLTADEDPSVPAILINGTILHSEAFGNPNDPMVVAIHGGPGVDYRSILNAKDLANHGYYVVFYDQRGTGLSERLPKHKHSLQALLDELGGVIQHYRTSPSQKIFLFGHSWGAILATAYINQYPSKINGAILAEAGGFTWEQIKEFISEEQEFNLFSESTNDALYFDQIFTGKENDHAVLDYKAALASASEAAEGNKLGNAGPVPFWRLGAVANKALFEIAEQDGFDFIGNLHQFETKILFVYGGLNQVYNLNRAQQVSAPYPSVQIERIDGAGHEVVHFGWNKFYPIALNYLNELK